MARRSKAEIARERAVEIACNKACVGKQINIMDLSKIKKAADEASHKTVSQADIDAAAEKVAAELNAKA